jgi:hypothetical protein
MSEMQFLFVGLTIGFALGYAFQVLRDFFVERR